MTHPRLMPGSWVRKLLAIPRTTLQSWNAAGSGHLVPHSFVAQEPHFTYEALDALLAAGARNFATPPTIQSLRQNEVTLLTTERAAHLLGRSPKTIPDIIRLGRLPAIKLNHSYRIPLESVLDYLDIEEDPSRISRQQAELVLGGSRWLVTQLVGDGSLVETSHPHNPHLRPVTRESLLAYLQREGVLPDWIDPEDWLDERIASGEPLVTTGVAATRLVLHRSKLPALLQNGSLRYIRPQAGVTIMVEPASIQAYLRQLKPLTFEELGKIFAMNVASAWHARQKGRLDCPIHAHDDNKLYEPCVLALLHTMLTPGTYAPHWYRGRLYSNMPTVTLTEAALLLETTSKQVVRMTQGGSLPGLCMLGARRDRYVFSRLTVMKARRARQRP